MRSRGVGTSDGTYFFCVCLKIGTPRFRGTGKTFDGTVGEARLASGKNFHKILKLGGEL